MDAEARKLVEKLKPEVSRVIFALDDYLTCKEELDAPLKDCSRPIAEGRQFLEVTLKYIDALRAIMKESALEPKLDYLKKEVCETIMRSIPYHYLRLSSEFPELMNGHAKKTN